MHSVGGWAALAGALILGPRIGKYKDGKVVPMPGANLPLATLGVFICGLVGLGLTGVLSLQWAQSEISNVSRIFANTNAAAGGAIAALILTQVVYGKVDLTMVLNGALAGLVSQPTIIGRRSVSGAVGGLLSSSPFQCLISSKLMTL